MCVCACGNFWFFYFGKEGSHTRSIILYMHVLFVWKKIVYFFIVIQK